MIPVTFERAQWPVGHGGFHTGKLQVGDGEPLSYFFDCGGQNGSLIDHEFKNEQYEFGVLSHFHHDHLAKIASATVKKIFLPYLGPIGWLHLVASRLIDSDDTSTADALVTAYANLTRDPTKTVIWVGRSRIRGEVREADAADAAEGVVFEDNETVVLSGVQPNAEGAIGDGSSIALRTKHELLVNIRFFNFRQDAIAAAFEAAVRTRLGSMLDAHGASYPDVPALWKAIETEGGQAIYRLKDSLKAAYMEASKSQVPHVEPVNLSSLTMWTSPLLKWYPWTQRCQTLTWSLDVFSSAPVGIRGWMLTGDLELTDDVWPEFYKHYFHQIPRSLLFNVPHHCSTDAIGPQAAHHLIKKTALVACVPTRSKDHPSGAFVQLLAARQSGAFPVTKELDTKLTHVFRTEI